MLTAAGGKLAASSSFILQRRCAMLLLLWTRAASASSSHSKDALPYAPRSYYRFETATDLTLDTVGNISLAPSGFADPVGRTDGGQVGGYLSLVNSTGAYGAPTWAANAGQLPRQCISNRPLKVCKAGGPHCACADPTDPQGLITGLTVEFLLRAGHNTTLQGNTTLLASAGGSREAPASNNWIDISRHGISFRQLTGAGDVPRWYELLALANGTGRASAGYLLDGEWHHLVFRRATGGGVTRGKLDVWIDGAVPNGTDAWFGWPTSRRRNPTGAWQYALEDAAPQLDGAHFGNWTYGEWPDLVLLPEPFDGDLDEVALYEMALPDEVIRRHYREAMLDGTAYSFGVAPVGPAPDPDPAPKYDLREFAPGTVLPTPPVPLGSDPKLRPGPTRNGNVSVIDQLQSFPLPRYPPGTLRGDRTTKSYSISTATAANLTAMQHNGQCFDATYLGGENQKGMSNEGIFNATMPIMRELVSVWRYLPQSGNTHCPNSTDPYCGWFKMVRTYLIVFGGSCVVHKLPSPPGEYSSDELTKRFPHLPCTLGERELFHAVSDAEALTGPPRIRRV